jgi:hypothetical protein
VANEVAHDAGEVTDNIEEDDTAAIAALSAHHSTPENQLGSAFVQAAGKVPVKVNKKKQWQMPAIVAVAFVMIFTALVYVYCWGWSALSIDDEAEVESNGIEECKDDIMAALAAESNNEYTALNRALEDVDIFWYVGTHTQAVPKWRQRSSRTSSPWDFRPIIVHN